MEDSRALLGLSPNATRSEAQRAFRRLAKLTHPDTGGAAADFGLVAGAWADLAAALPADPVAAAGTVAPRRRIVPVRSPHVQAYAAPATTVVWVEPRPAVRRDFAALLDSEIARLAA
jgi:hypothetical protein